MTKKQVEIVNKTGLHARPASDFVLEAKKYESKITICREKDRLRIIFRLPF